MDAKTNYQLIMIRTILENGIAPKESIDEKIRLANPGKENKFVSHEVYEVLVQKHKMIKLNVNGYQLDLPQPLAQIERDKLIELCNQEIVRLTEVQQLNELSIAKTHHDILKKFHKKRGRYLPASEIYGEKKDRDRRKVPSSTR